MAAAWPAVRGAGLVETPPAEDVAEAAAVAEPPRPLADGTLAAVVGADDAAEALPALVVPRPPLTGPVTCVEKVPPRPATLTLLAG
jgi:hypothetical protein